MIVVIFTGIWSLVSFWVGWRMKWWSLTQLPYGEYVARYVRADKKFMAGVRAGMKAYREGDKGQPWEDVKRELHIGETNEP